MQDIHYIYYGVYEHILTQGWYELFRLFIINKLPRNVRFDVIFPRFLRDFSYGRRDPSTCSAELFPNSLKYQCKSKTLGHILRVTNQFNLLAQTTWQTVWPERVTRTIWTSADHIITVFCLLYIIWYFFLEVCTSESYLPPCKKQWILNPQIQLPETTRYHVLARGWFWPHGHWWK